MRIAFRKRPYDLVVVVGVSLVLLPLVSLGSEGPLRFVVAFASVLFAPGYTLAAALFPKDGEMDWIERIALSFGLSIAAVALLGVILNYTPLGVRLESIAGALLSFTVVVGAIAYGRRIRVPAERRLSFMGDFEAPRWGEFTALDKAITGVLVAIIAVGIVAIGYVLSVPQAKSGFTEFFLLDDSGQPVNYPTRLNVSQTANVTPVVVNHEYAQVYYSVRIDLVGIRLIYNATSGSNETVETNRTTWSWFNDSLADGRSWTWRYTFSIASAGLWKVQFLLFRDGDFASEYRLVELRITVS
jgi:uncharacterized membrane protein